MQALVGILSRQVRDLKTSTLAHNAGWMLIGQGLNVVLQAAYFVLLARLLGVREYGVFAGAFAFVAMVIPYSTLGSGMLFIRYVSTHRENFAAYLGNILFASTVAGSLLTILLCFIAPHLLNPASASLILVVALGECICRQLVSCMGQVFQAFEQLRMTALLNLTVSALRVLAAGGMTVFMHHASAAQWALSSLIVSALAGIVACAIVIARFGSPRFVPSLFLSKCREGMGFSIAGSSQSIYNDIDKTMLSHYAMNVANGIYTLAYRIVDIATVPITALDSAALPRFFRQSKDEFASVPALSIRLTKRAACLGALTAAILFISAPLIPHVIGHGFSESVMALRWLCFLPVFRAVHQLTGSAITGMGYQRFRTVAQIFAAALNLGLNMWMIPRFGWLGAAWASLAADGALAATNWMILQYVSGHAHQAPANPIVNISGRAGTDWR